MFGYGQQSGTFANGNFETGDFTGWTQGGGYWSGGWPLDPSSYLPGGQNYNSSAYVNNVLGPGPMPDPRTDGQLDAIYSGQKTARVNDSYNNNSVSVISQTVTAYTAPHIYFAWAAVLQASHGPTDSDNFILQLKDVTTGETLYQVAYNSADAQTASLFTQSKTGWFYTAWQVQDLDVSERAGHTFTLTLLASDCPYGGHAGYVYLDGFGAVAPPSGPTGGEGLTLSGNTNLGTFRAGSTVAGSVDVTGGTPPYKFSGVAPDGYTFTDGSISGVAAFPGNYSATVIVSDSLGSSTAATFTWSVFGFTLRALPDGVQYSPYVASLGLSGGTAPFNFIVTGLPPGISATSSGTLQGISRQAGTWSVSISGTDGDGRSVSGAFTLRIIVPPPLSVTSTNISGALLGSVYSQDLAAAGGAPPYTWTLTAGALPDGLILRPGGTVAGIPGRAGTFTLGVRVTDVTGGGASGQVTFTVAPLPITIRTPSPLATGMASVEYPDQTFSATGGMTPYTFRLTGGTLPAGLSLAANGLLSGTPTPGSAGSYPLTVTATDASGRTGTATPSLTIRTFSQDILLSSGSLLFELVSGTTVVPSAQTVGVQLTKPGNTIPYSVNITPAGTNWLTVRTGGTAPGTLSISLAPSALQMAAAGTPYVATVEVACTNASVCGGSVQSLQVALRVSIVPPQLYVPGDLVSFSTSPANQQQLTQSLEIQNVGGGAVGIGSVSCAASWCTVTGAPGFLSSGVPAQLTVGINPAGLNSGFYRTTVTLKTSTGTATVPVTLFISNSDSLGLQPSGAQFLSSVGGVPVGGTSSFFVVAGGTASVPWSASVLPGANWLTLGSPSGSSSGSQPGTVNFSVNPGVASGLAAGTYYGQIRVTAAGVANSPLDFEVVLNVAPAGTPQRPNPAPSGLLFITGSNPLPSQTVSIANGSAQPLTYTAASDSPWLKVTPASGTALPGVPAASAVSVDATGLRPGVYYGGINYEFGGPVRTANVALIVPSTGQTVNSLGFTSRATCAPAQLVAVQTGLPGNFAAPAAWPTPITLRLFNDCGDAITNGQTAVTFSNGDPPLVLSLVDSKTATYAGTWTPRRASAQISIKARSTAPGLPVAVTEIAGAVTPNDAPILESSAALHIFNPQKGAALAPGTLLTLTGTALAGVPATAPAGNLPTTLGGTKVLIGGVSAPIASVSPTSLTVQAPVELDTARQYQVIVSANGALTSAQNVPLFNVSPGIQASAGGFATAFVSGKAVSQSAPAAPGDKVTVFAAGLGTTDPVVAAGAVTPSDQLVRITSPVTLNLDGKQVPADFAGLQAGTVGIYQIDFTVPADAKDGDLPLDMTQDGQAANTVYLSVKKKP